jgi:hypothetical protein
MRVKRLVLLALIALPGTSYAQQAPPIEAQGLAIVSWITNMTQELAALRARNAELTVEVEKLKAAPK